MMKIMMMMVMVMTNLLCSILKKVDKRHLYRSLKEYYSVNERDIFSGVVASSVCENSPRPASLTSSIWITYWWPIFTPLLVTWFASGVALYRDEHTQHSERYLRKKCQLIRKLVLKNIVCHLSILYQTIQKLIFGFKVYLLNIKITSLNRFIWLEHNQNYYLKT